MSIREQYAELLRLRLRLLTLMELRLRLGRR